MSKQNKVEETKEVTMEELETGLAEVETGEEPIEQESKIKKFWAKVKKPLIIGGAAVGGFILGKVLGSKDDDDYVVYEMDSEDEVVDEDEAE